MEKINDKKNISATTEEAAFACSKEAVDKALSLFVELNPGPVLRCGPDGIIQYANKVAKDIFGIYGEEKPVLCKILPCSEDIYIKNCIKNDSVIEFTAPVGSKYYQFVFKGVSELGIVQIYGSDITNLKDAEEKLRTAKSKAESATMLKDKFVSVVAHDLRSPFTSIIGFLRLLLRPDTIEPLTAGQKDKLARVLGSCESMVELIGNLLDINRLQTGELTPQKILMNTKPAVESNLSKLRYLAIEKGISLEEHIPEELNIHADPDLFSVVIQNLVSNAIKFSNKGDKVAIYIPQSKASCIAVADTGVGISAEIRDSLFTHTAKISTRGTSGEKGTGLGLQFAFDIMKAHGGSLTVDSTVGEGSTFYLEFPGKDFSLTL
jgi:signal transduction histidine kinase